MAATNPSLEGLGLDPEDLNLGLHPKQFLALQSPATEILFGGAKGGGKSHLMRVAAICWAHLIDGLQVYLFRRTSPDLLRNHMNGPGSFPSLLSHWMRVRDVSYDGSKGHWKFRNGSRILLCHCQHTKDMHDYQGAEMHVLMIDQLEQWEKEVYEFLRGQVRLGGLRVPSDLKGLFPRVLVSANPGGIGHNWVKEGFVSLAPEFALTRMLPEKGGMLRQYIPSLLEDNPTMLENDPTYEDRLSGMGSPAMVKALRWGIWDIVAGGAIDDVWDPSFHVIPPFRIPKNWQVERALDWGSSRPFSVGWWARSDGSEVMTAKGMRSFYPGSKIRVAEFYGWNGEANEGCRMIPAEVARKILEIENFLSYKHQIRPGPADASIFDSDRSIADDMLRVGVRWTMADKRPGSREAGLLKLRTMLKAGLQSPMEEPGLFVFDTCRHFIRTIPVLPRDERKPDDVNTSAEDHVYDETRYEIMTPPRVDVVEQVVI